MLSLYLSQCYPEKIVFGQGWIWKTERIRCSAPLPEDSADPVLTRMLAHAPYQVPSGEDKEGSGEVKSGLHTSGTLRTISGEIGTLVSESKWRGESNIPFPHGKKRAAPQRLEGGGLQAREEIPDRGSCLWEQCCRTTPSRGLAASQDVSEQECSVSLPHSSPVYYSNI